MLVKSLHLLRTSTLRQPKLFIIKQTSTSIYFDEPEYKVSSDPILDPKFIRVPYLRDSTKQEIYQKYKNDPIKWSSKILAQTYGATETRIKAVIYLMKFREEMMTKKELLEITPQQFEIYELSLDKANDLATLAEKYSLPQQEIERIIKKLTDHNRRLSNLECMETYNEGVMKEFSNLGVDVNFSEPPTYYSQNIENKFFPTLFGDENLEQHKRELLKRIEKETKAHLKPHPALTYLKKLFGDDVSVDVDGNVIQNGENVTKVTDVVPLPVQAESASNSNQLESRFKFAFRDLSLPDTMQKTVIRTRTGK